MLLGRCASQSAELGYFMPPDVVPDLGAVRLLQKQTADDKGHAQRQQSSKDAVAYLCALHLLGWPRVLLLNCALDERFVESRRAGSLRPVARLERVLRVQNVKMVPPSDSVCQRPIVETSSFRGRRAPRSRIRKGSANVRLAQNVKIVPNSLRHECA